MSHHRQDNAGSAVSLSGPRPNILFVVCLVCAGTSLGGALASAMLVTMAPEVRIGAPPAAPYLVQASFER